MSDLKDPPPNASWLQQALDETFEAKKRKEVTPPESTVLIQSTPFNRTMTMKLPIICDNKYCGLTFNQCEHSYQDYIDSIIPGLSVSNKVPYQKSFLHAFFLGVNHIPVTTREDSKRAFYQLLEVNTASYDTISLLIAPAARSETLSDTYNIPQMQMDQLRHVALAVQTITTTPGKHYNKTDVTFPPDKPFSDDEINYFIHSTNQVMINKATSKGKLTQRKLKQGDQIEWKLWL